MLKPLSRRQLDAVRADPICYDGDHRDHDAYVAMVGGEYRLHYDPDLHRKMAEPNRPRFDPAKIKLNGAVGPRASANNSHDEKTLEDAFAALSAFGFGSRDDPRDGGDYGVGRSNRLRVAIRGFQRANGLEPDGEMTPNGPTANALRRMQGDADGVSLRPSPLAPGGTDGERLPATSTRRIDPERQVRLLRAVRELPPESQLAVAKHLSLGGSRDEGRSSKSVNAVLPEDGAEGGIVQTSDRRDTSEPQPRQVIEKERDGTVIINEDLPEPAVLTEDLRNALDRRYSATP